MVPTHEVIPELFLILAAILQTHLTIFHHIGNGSFDHHRKTVSLYALKGWLYQMPGSIYADVNSAIEATYATTPLNKIRWEKKEFVPFGGVIF